MRLKLCVLTASLMIAGAIAGTTAMADEKPDQITIFSGRAGGSWYGMGGGLAKIFIDNGVKSSAEVGGGISNLAMVGAGKGELGFSMSIVPRMGRLGMAPFKSKVTNIMAIAQLSANKVHIVVSKSSGVNSIADLRGKKFATQPVGNVTTEAFKAVLAAKGMTESDLNLTRGGQGYGAKEMKDRRIVGFTATTTPPSPALAEIAQSIDVKFLGIDDETFALMKKANPGFVRDTLKAGTYRGQTEAVPTAATAMIIVVNEAMPDAQAYWIAKTMSENLSKMRNIHKAWSKLTVKGLASVTGVELHPGAAKYYREAGAL